MNPILNSIALVLAALAILLLALEVVQLRYWVLPGMRGRLERAEDDRIRLRKELAAEFKRTEYLIKRFYEQVRANQARDEVSLKEKLRAGLTA